MVTKTVSDVLNRAANLVHEYLKATLTNIPVVHFDVKKQIVNKTNRSPAHWIHTLVVNKKAPLALDM